MPLLDIATTPPYLFSLRSQSPYHNHATFIIGNESATARWIYFSIPDKPKKFERRWRCGGFVVKAVATIEPKPLIQNNGKLHLGIDSTPTEDSEDVNDKELLRRKRISKANHGKRHWNLGRKHSPETLERIRQRTKLAMQNPKIRMKLQSLGHAQSEETRVKIGDGVRMKRKKRQEKQMLQETCRFEWENLVAEASRKGFYGEEELQWNSFKILEEQLEQEWLESVKQRKEWLATRGNRRAPKSLEHRRKISAAIVAKWADPEFRNRVSSGQTKYHGSHHNRVRKPRRETHSDEKPKTKSPANQAKPATNLIDMQKQCPKFRRSKGPSYEDPLTSSKLEMLKSIRAQRAAAEISRSEVIRETHSDEKPKTKSPANQAKPAINLIDMQKQCPKFRRSKGPSYEDPLTSSKLEMLKSIRAQRAAAEISRSEVIRRAKLMIAEAQKAAQALEIAAESSSLARASLIESRKLIAEAMESIGSIDIEYLHSEQISKSSSFTSPDPLNHVEREPDLEFDASASTSHEKVNGFRTMGSSDLNFLDYDFSNVRKDLLHSLDNDDDGIQPSFYNRACVNGNLQLHPPGSNDFEFTKLELEHMITHSSFTKQFGDLIPNGTDRTDTSEVISHQPFGSIEGDGDQESILPHHLSNFESEKEETQLKPQTKKKKWVRGRLVEVDGE